jgi:sensor c-di-GMP phosphodiesterase-like protein
LKTLIDLGTQLGLTLIAEGVEQPAQAELLKGQTVKYSQGWLFCRALPAADFLDRLKLDG